MAPFGFRLQREGEAQAERRRIVGWVRAAGGYTDETILKVNEIVCADPACPGMETVILVMPPGKPTFARKIAKPLGDVTHEDVVGALNTGG